MSDEQSEQQQGEKRPYIVRERALTQHGEDGKAHVYNPGDTIYMTDADAKGQARYVEPLSAAPAATVVDEDDESL